MSEVREEYTRETYPSFGKKYNGEKAIISLTSWRARISTVSKTLFSLIQQCPDFHIVLVLSEEEFPKMMDELPDNLKLFVDNELIEVLWVYKNYKSFKKVLFTMDKYRDVPIISADDDCIYTCNYAQKFYNAWLKNKSTCISNAVYKKYGYIWTNGQCTLYRPYCFLNHSIDNINLCFKFGYNDDAFISSLYKRLKIECIKIEAPLYFHTTKNALSPNGTGSGYNAKKDITDFYKHLVIK